MVTTNPYFIDRFAKYAIAPRHLNASGEPMLAATYNVVDSTATACSGILFDENDLPGHSFWRAASLDQSGAIVVSWAGPRDNIESAGGIELIDFIDLEYEGMGPLDVQQITSEESFVAMCEWALYGAASLMAFPATLNKELVRKLVDEIYLEPFAFDGRVLDRIDWMLGAGRGFGEIDHLHGFARDRQLLANCLLPHGRGQLLACL